MTTLIVLAGFAAAHPLPYVGVGPPEVPDVVPPPIGIVDPGLMDCGGADRYPRTSFGGVCLGSDPADGWGQPYVCTPEYFFECFWCDPFCVAPDQHLQQGTIDIQDSTFVFVAATFCQDLNRDGLCGGDRTGGPESESGGNPSAVCQSVHEEGASGCAYRSEPYIDFCDNLSVNEGLTGSLAAGSRREAGVYPSSPGSGDWADPTVDNWAVDFDAYVFFHTPVRGNPVINGPCGAFSGGHATQGEVYHG